MTEQVDFAKLAQQYRDEGAEEWVIWLAEHAQEIADEILGREYAAFLQSLLPTDIGRGDLNVEHWRIDGDN